MEPIVTGKVRFSYVNIFRTRLDQDGTDSGKYSITLLIPKSDAATKKALDEGMKKALQEGLASKFGGVMPPSPRTPLYDGDGVRPSGEPFGAECKGHWVITASTKTKPQVVGPDRAPILNETEVYSGCYGRVSLRFFAYSMSGNKGVGCGLGNVQKLEDGEPLGGGTSAAQDFGAPEAGPVDPITGLPL